MGSINTSNYIGCYKNQHPKRVGGHTYDQTISDCEALAKSRNKGYFGMEHPQGSSKPNASECLVLDSIPNMDIAEDSECQNQLDSQQRRLGDDFRLAVYSIGRLRRI